MERRRKISRGLPPPPPELKPQKDTKVLSEILTRKISGFGISERTFVPFVVTSG
jgi:hypothetical protein